MSIYKVASNVCSTPALAACLTIKNAPCNLRCYGALCVRVGQPGQYRFGGSAVDYVRIRFVAINWSSESVNVMDATNRSSDAWKVLLVSSAASFPKNR